jgi:hypothetical protein
MSYVGELEEASIFRRLAQEVRGWTQSTMSSVDTAPELELLALKYERIAANLERGWPRDG